MHACARARWGGMHAQAKGGGASDLLPECESRERRLVHDRSCDAAVVRELHRLGLASLEAHFAKKVRRVHARRRSRLQNIEVVLVPAVSDVVGRPQRLQAEGPLEK